MRVLSGTAVVRIYLAPVEIYSSRLYRYRAKYPREYGIQQCSTSTLLYLVPIEALAVDYYVPVRILQLPDT